MTLLIKPIDLPGVKIVQNKIHENPTSVDPPYRPAIAQVRMSKFFFSYSSIGHATFGPVGGGVKIFRKI